MSGDNFYLRLAQTGKSLKSGLNRIGIEHSISYWYDLIRSSVTLTPIPGREISELDWLPEEELILASRKVKLLTESRDSQNIMAADLNSNPRVSLEGRLSPWQDISLDKIDIGRLFLTNQRLVWVGNGLTLGFSHQNIHLFYAMLNVGVAMIAADHFFYLFFQEESLLKWIAYMGLIAEKLLRETGHKIVVSGT